MYYYSIICLYAYIIIIYQLEGNPSVKLTLYYGYESNDIKYDEMLAELSKVDKPGCIVSLFAQHYFGINKIPLYNVEWYNGDRKGLITIHDIINKHIKEDIWEIEWMNINFIKYRGVIIYKFYSYK